MALEMTLRLLQKDLQTQNERWLELKLTGPRVVAPISGLMYPQNERWLATTQADYYHMWGLWSLGLNSLTVGPDPSNPRPDPSKTLGGARPDERGWRYSMRSLDLEFVELHQMTGGGPPEIRKAAVLTNALVTQRGFAPDKKMASVGRGFIELGSGFLKRGSITWDLM
jgi:hypothetical protein